MSIPEYEYSLEQCDVPTVRRAALSEYRAFRLKCLEYMRGDSDASVMNQVHDLAWHTAVFRTLNEARRIEATRTVSGAMWELLTAGYANIMTLGIRKLVDRDERTNSIWNVIAQIERRPELLRRENYVCYDGLPYDCQKGYKKYVDSLDLSTGSHVGWLPTKGAQAWGTSEVMHQSFDKLAGYPSKRKRVDPIHSSVLINLKAQLSSEAIRNVCTMADKQVAHAERIAKNSEARPLVTYNTIDEALRVIVRVTNFLSANFFQDAAFGSVVPTPQFDVLEGLDKPWVTEENLPTLHKCWHEIAGTMDRWTDGADEEFLPPPPDAGASSSA